jgi:type I restriction enzyme M protein
MQEKISNFLKEEPFVLKKRNLIVSPNLKKIFDLINQHIYAKLKYTNTDTRARSKEIINLLLCKLVDELDKEDDEELEIYIKHGESSKELLKRIRNFFEIRVKRRFDNIFSKNEQIELTKELVFLIIKELQEISLLESSQDILGDAYEMFVSKALKDEGGQFFTPPNVIRFMVNYLDPNIESRILDPACGHGGFLLEVKKLFWEKLDRTYSKDDEKLENYKKSVISNLYGIDKDSFLARLCKLYLEILSGGTSHIFCENSLDVLNYPQEIKSEVSDEKFDIIFTNPPFGAKIPIDDKNVLKTYALGHIWKPQLDNSWVMQKKLTKMQPPQILFIERCVQLLKEGGKLGIVLPEGIFGNPSDRYIWEFLEQNGKILGVVSLDQDTFQPYTCNKTSILFYQKLKNLKDDYLIDFAIVDKVGHDKDGKVLYKLNKDGTQKVDEHGNPIIDDDLLDLSNHLKNSEEIDFFKEQKLFKIKFSDIKDKIYIPSYYIGVEKVLKKLSQDNRYELVSILELVKRGIIYTNKNGLIPRGDEIGSNLYGLGDIPFIRTSDITNWEINLNSHKKTSEEVYLHYKERQNIEEGDILLVKDGGPNLIGNVAYITELDTQIIIQSHIFQIKVLQNASAIDSYLLLYLLNLDIVQKQIQAITFVQGTIATIGNRILDVILPIPSDIRVRKQISDNIKTIIKEKMELRTKILNLKLETFLDNHGN